MVAAFCGLLGAALTWYVGTHYLAFSTGDAVLAVVAANVASLVSLPGTLLAQRSRLLKPVMRGWFPSWVLISVLWLGVLFLICPNLRDSRLLAPLFLPLLLSTGFFVLSYGRVHDRVFAWSQRRERARTQQTR